MVFKYILRNKQVIVGILAVAIVLLLAGMTYLILQKKEKVADVASIKTFEQCNDAGFPIIKHYPDQCQTPDGRIFVNNNPPGEAELALAEQAIRTFMGDWDHPQMQESKNHHIDLKYIGQNRHPNNFAVLSNVKSNAGGLTADNPEEWDRPAYIFQQANYIDSLCEVYEYEILIKTKQVVEISIVYPKKPNEKAQGPGPCLNYDSLEVPLKTKTEIEQTAYMYLGRDPEHTKILLRSDIQPGYNSDKVGTAKNPEQNEWVWEDKSISLPEGLTGDPWQHPMIRIVISSGGKLVYYLNTTGLF